MRHALLHAHSGEGALRAGNAFLRRNPGVDQRQFDIVQSRGPRQQIEGLEHEPDFLVPDSRQLVIIQFADQLIVQPVIAFARRIETADQIHQRRFSRTGWSHDRDVFVPPNLQIDSAQGVHLLLRAHVVCLPQILGRDHALTRRLQPCGLCEIHYFGGCHFSLLVLWGHFTFSIRTAPHWTSHPNLC